MRVCRDVTVFVIGSPRDNFMQCTGSWKVNAAVLWIVDSSVYLSQKRRDVRQLPEAFTVPFPFSGQWER